MQRRPHLLCEVYAWIAEQSRMLARGSPGSNSHNTRTAVSFRSKFGVNHGAGDIDRHAREYIQIALSHERDAGVPGFRHGCFEQILHARVERRTPENLAPAVFQRGG